MNTYLGHQFENGQCIRCGAVEKSIRKFHIECAKADAPIGASDTAELAATAQSSTAGSPIVHSSDQIQSKGPQSVPGTPSQVNRYRDAYLVAKATSAVGHVVKMIGFALGAVIVIAGGVVAMNGGGAPGFLGGLLLGIIVAVAVYILGLLLSAQAQVLRASLDTAVHTSPFLTREEMVRVMSL